MFLRILAVVALFAFANLDLAQACSCFSSGDHSQTVEQRAVRSKDPRYSAQESLIAEVEILNHHGHGMDVGILQVLVGSESRSQVTVWGDPGHLCRPYTSQFKAGTRWLLLIDKNAHPYKGESSNDYSISICGTYFLPVSIVQSQKVIKGAITPGVTEMPLSMYPQWYSEILKKVDESVQKLQAAADQWEISCWAQIVLENPTNHHILASLPKAAKFKLNRENPLPKLSLTVDPQKILSDPSISAAVAQELTSHPISMDLDLNYSVYSTREWMVDPTRYLNFTVKSLLSEVESSSSHVLTLDLFDRNLRFRSGSTARPLKTPDHKLRFSFGLY